MQFNVSDLLREGYGAFREYDLDDDLVIEGETRHVTGHARFDRTPGGILVRAKLSGVADADCCRCLQPFRFTVDVEFEEQYVPTIDPVTSTHVTPPEGEEDAYRVSERHMLDLSEPVRQYWSMVFPMAPVCREDCAGICPLCGEERAAGHACDADPADARWEKLRSLRTQT